MSLWVQRSGPQCLLRGRPHNKLHASLGWEQAPPSAPPAHTLSGWAEGRGLSYLQVFPDQKAMEKGSPQGEGAHLDPARVGGEDLLTAPQPVSLRLSGH